MRSIIRKYILKIITNIVVTDLGDALNELGRNIVAQDDAFSLDSVVFYF